MHFGISRHGNIEIRHFAQQLDQIRRVKRFFVVTGGLVAAQRHDAADAAVPVIFGDLAQFVGRGIDAGQVRRGIQPRFLFDSFDNSVRTVAFAGVGAVSNGDEFRTQGLQTSDRVPQHGFHLFVFRREKLERYIDVAVQIGNAAIQLVNLSGVAHVALSLYFITLFCLS